MQTWQAIIIALAQGLTEFLPVSSSGHMVLIEALLGVDPPGALWEIAFHLGTLAAVAIVFRRDLGQVIAGTLRGAASVAGGAALGETWSSNQGFRLGGLIVIGTVPAGVVGFGFKDQIEGLFSAPLLAASLIFVTGTFLWLSRPWGLTRSEGRLRFSDAVAMGVAQAVAILPGISRSGATIATGLMRGVDRATAARFSFLLSVPAILGAAALDARQLGAVPPEHILPLCAGVAVAALSGYLALKILLRLVRGGRMHVFAWYCWAVSIAGVAWLWAARTAAP